MTGNVAQVFVTDAAWHETLEAMGRAVRLGGWLVFESRDPAVRAWEHWTIQATYRELVVPGVGAVTTWTEVLDVDDPLVSFRHVFRFAADRNELTSLSTLRFRSYDEIIAALQQAGFRTDEVRDAPDRPGMEFVFFAQNERDRDDDLVARGLRRGIAR